MRSAAASAVVALLALPAVAGAQVGAQAPAGTTPAAAAPQTQPAPSAGQPTATPGVPQTPAPPGPITAPPPATATAPAAGRTFAAPVGLLFNTVRTERVTDFEKVLGYLQAALQKSSDPNVQAQARGWRMFKATEPGPNSTVLYVFEFNPTVPGADYGLGRILADAYPDPALLQEIWRLYTTSVTSGGSLLNLTPVTPVDPTIAGPRGTTTPGAVPGATPETEPRMLPPDVNPVRRP